MTEDWWWRKVDDTPAVLTWEDIECAVEEMRRHDHGMSRQEALAKIEADYGAATMNDDPEWVEDMVEILLDDPTYLDDHG